MRSKCGMNGNERNRSSVIRLTRKPRVYTPGSIYTLEARHRGMHEPHDLFACTCFHPLSCAVPRVDGADVEADGLDYQPLHIFQALTDRRRPEIIDATRSPVGAQAPRAPHCPAPETQRKSRQQKLCSFFRQAKKGGKHRQNGSIKLFFFARTNLLKEYVSQNGSIKQIFSPAETKAMRFYGTCFHPLSCAVPHVDGADVEADGLDYQPLQRGDLVRGDDTGGKGGGGWVVDGM
jgi:hypothetical protein